MTDIARKALALVNEVSIREWTDFTHADPWTLCQALCRAIEQHEAFRQEVSDAAVEYNEHGAQSGWLGFDHFIIPKPDPLVEAIKACNMATLDGIEDAVASDLRAALAARGLKIVEDK